MSAGQNVEDVSAQSQTVSRSITEAEHDTLADERPVPLKPSPTDPEKGDDKKGEAGAKWRDTEIHEIPYK